MKEQFDPASVEEAMRIARTPVGQQFVNALKQSDPKVLEGLMADAKSGNYESLKKNLTELMKNETIQAYLAQMRGNSNG